ncbi:MAG: hypothetical protein M5R40_26760 [Anaerolineae bacterium]|nr:hypothetical protein [Anaerolineae bacterium]
MTSVPHEIVSSTNAANAALRALSTQRARSPLSGTATFPGMSTGPAPHSAAAAA